MKPYIRVDNHIYRFGVKASSTGSDVLTKVETYEGHTFYVDEPKEVHGLGRAPNPIEIFLSSLASCFIITLKIHSARLNLPINDVEAFAEGAFNIKGFILPQRFESGFTSITLSARVKANTQCVELIKLLETVTSGWVVGSTISNAIPINLKVEVVCLDGDGSLRSLEISKVVSKST